MARYDVFPNPSGGGFVLDVQANLLDGLKTRVVVPLLANPGDVKPVRKLNPVFTIGDRQYTMFAHLIGTVPVSRLGEPRANLSHEHDEIVAALDMLFQGF
jgi:toxin CcdB